jgi:type II secretory pathway pseudopilin PulG
MKKAFSLIELIVSLFLFGFILIFLLFSYKENNDQHYFYTQYNSLKRENNIAIEQIIKRLNLRISNTLIVRLSNNSNAQPYSVSNNKIMLIEWINIYYEGLNGIWNNSTQALQPLWTGVIDDNQSLTYTVKNTDFDKIDTQLNNLGAENDDLIMLNPYVKTNNTDQYGWNKSSLNTNGYIFIDKKTKHTMQLNKPYKEKAFLLGWTANALSLDGDTLYLHFNYQPWKKEYFDDKTTPKAPFIRGVSQFDLKLVNESFVFILCTQKTIKQNKIEYCSKKVLNYGF